MGNRNQDNQYGSRRSSNSRGDYGRSGGSQWDGRSQDDDEGRYTGGADRESGGYGNGGHGSNENYSGPGNVGQGDYNQRDSENSGQGRYGEGRYGQGQSNYRGVSRGDEYGSSGTSQYGRSNFGSGGQGWSEPYGEGQQYGNRGSQGGLQGLHRGKGPKGYQRSDERIKELVSDSLSDHPEIDASEITVSIQGGKLTLEGSVDSRQTKNAVEDIAEKFCQDVQNNLKVNRQGQGQGQAGSSGKSAGSSSKSSTSSDESDGNTRQKRN